MLLISGCQILGSGFDHAIFEYSEVPYKACIHVVTHLQMHCYLLSAVGRSVFSLTSFHYRIGKYTVVQQKHVLDQSLGTTTILTLLLGKQRVLATRKILYEH